jgi:hypothetical protein
LSPAAAILGPLNEPKDDAVEKDGMRSCWDEAAKPEALGFADVLSVTGDEVVPPLVVPVDDVSPSEDGVETAPLGEEGCATAPEVGAETLVEVCTVVGAVTEDAVSSAASVGAFVTCSTGSVTGAVVCVT